MKNRILPCLASLLMLLSCMKEAPYIAPEPEYPASGKAISIKPSVDEEYWSPLATKALSDLTDHEVNQAYLENNGFGVYAYYTGDKDFVSISDTFNPADSSGTVKGLVFNKRKFLYNNGLNKWQNYQYNGADYSQTGKDEFWPTSSADKLTFFAFAPWDAWYNDIHADATQASPYIEYTAAANLNPATLEAQKDILWGTNTAGMPHKDVSMSSYPDGTVDMHFRHAVAKVKFTVKGSVPGGKPMPSGTPTVTTNPIAGTESTTTGEWVETGRTDNRYTYTASGTGYSRRWYCVRREVITETRDEIQSQEVTQNRESDYVYSGSRYYVDNVHFNGFKGSGTLLLGNESAYAPTWKNVTGTINYTLDGTNVLATSLRNVGATTIRNNIGTYTGIQESPTDLMGGYYLYAIPTASGSLSATIEYTRYTVTANTIATEYRDGSQSRVRKNTRTYTRELRSTNYIQQRNDPGANNNSWNFDENNWVTSGTSYQNNIQLGYSTVTNGTWGAWSEVEGDYVIVSEVPDPSKTNTVTFGATTQAQGNIVSTISGGNDYSINLVITGNKIELVVVPQPWEVEDQPAYTFDSRENEAIQPLDYDSAYIDYEEDGNVYINNRMGKFYFLLGEGKYLSWQASLVGDPAFGFTDENGNFLMEGGQLVSSIRGAIDPSSMNYIYVRAIDPQSTVTNRAKLRIYGIDSNNDATALLYIVNNDKVVEWTIVQNAN